MIRLTVVTLAALYAVLNVFGENRGEAEDVARTEPLEINLIQASVLPSDAEVTLPVSPSSISETEAVQLALAAGAELRAQRKLVPLQGSVETVTPELPTADAKPAEIAVSYWTVTGSRVNLRSGPGTSNDVVGQVSNGLQAEVLADRDGWYQIRTADGSASGWIFGKFLQPS